MNLDAELVAEGSYLKDARAQLDAMRRQSRQLADQTGDAAGDAGTAESLKLAYARRLESLDIAEELPVSFGAMTTPAEKHYIGRRHIRATDGEAMVIDWRAPIVQAYYRASTADPQGLQARRRFGFASGQLTAMEDESFDAGQHADSEPDALSPMVLAEVERPRVGPMRDIVSTIQADQDQLVRASLEEDLVIQGAPGTGKTAVGLHRAAYLLYSFKKQLAALGGVLVVGPSADFIRYIGDVLPALGETAVEHSTLPLLLGDDGTVDEPVDVSALKHSATMGEMLQRLMAGQFPPVTEPLAARIAYRRFRLSTSELERVRTGVLLRGQSHEGGRTIFVQRVAQMGVDATGAARAEVLKELRRGEAAQLLNQVWPKLKPETMLKNLLTDPELLARWAEGLFTDEEQELLQTRAKGRWAWTAADHVLLDELRWQLDKGQTFGHIIVDEAQDLSPMELRAIGRRRGRSMTLLGDLAQGTTPWAATSWEGARAHLGLDALSVSELETAFRTPAPVMRLANRLLARIAPTLTPPRAIRVGAEPNIVEVAQDALLKAANAEVLALLEHPGIVGVLCPAELLPAALEAGLGSDPRVSLIAAEAAKGLEFDSVLLLEPAALLSAEPSLTECRLLYIALTRAVSTLSIVQSRQWQQVLDG